jgi:hypothetical protein
MREQINHFLQCINIETFHDIHVSERKSKLNTIFQTNSDPIIPLCRSKTFPLSDSKIMKNQSTSHILQNRRKIIQQCINSAHHTPILNSAKT